MFLAATLTTGDACAASAQFSSGNPANAAPAFSAEQILTFAKKVERTLAAKGAHVALLARKGRPKEEMPEGMAFTHVGFAVYSEITTKDGRKLLGYAMYNLYQRDDKPDSSRLVSDYPADFFAAVAELEAGVLIPSPTLQKRLLDTITSPTYPTFHDSHYSAIANPYTLGKQNCTEFVLDVINAAIYQTANIQEIKANERAYFVAQKVNVNPAKLFFGSIFSSEIAISDHQMEVETATFETIARYLMHYDKGAELLTVTPDGPVLGNKEKK